jgi:hypothetical protein
MNALTFTAALALVALLTSARAQNTMPTAPATPPPYVYDQRSYARVPVLIDPSSADSIVDDFHTNLSTLGQRYLIYVNRPLPGDSADTNAASSIMTGKSAPTLADHQTVRDVERLVARPLRTAGATLIDEAALTRLNAGAPEPSREALTQSADVAIEVLVSSRSVTVPEVIGDKTYLVPDIQMTAIRLKDGHVLGQASAAEVMNRAGGPALVARNFGVQDVTEATSLALMDNMLHQTK